MFDYAKISAVSGYQVKLLTAIKAKMSGPCCLQLVFLIDLLGNSPWHKGLAIPTIAKEMSVSKSTVRRLLKRLEDLNLLEIDRDFYESGAQAPNKYTLNLKAVYELVEMGDVLTEHPPVLNECAASYLGKGGVQSESPDTQEDRPVDRPATSPDQPEPVPPAPLPDFNEPQPPAPADPPAVMPNRSQDDWRLIASRLCDEGFSGASELIHQAIQNDLTTGNVMEFINLYRQDPMYWGTKAVETAIDTGRMPSPRSMIVNDAKRSERIRRMMHRAGERRNTPSESIDKMVFDRLKRAGLENESSDAERSSVNRLKLHRRRG